MAAKTAETGYILQLKTPRFTTVALRATRLAISSIFYTEKTRWTVPSLKNRPLKHLVLTTRSLSTIIALMLPIQPGYFYPEFHKLISTPALWNWKRNLTRNIASWFGICALFDDSFPPRSPASSPHYLPVNS